MQGYWGRQFDHAFEWRTVDFESPDADSFATFGRSLDLFGDGSVRLVSTPGHTAGHLSVVLRLREREALLTGDAAYTRRTIEETALPYRMEDEHRFRRSLREIQLYDARAARRARDLRARLQAVAHAARRVRVGIGAARPWRVAVRPPRRRGGRRGRPSPRARRPSVRSRECSARTSSKIISDAACDCSRVGSSTCSKPIGSPNCTVTFGNWSRFQLRTRSVPAIAVGHDRHAVLERQPADARSRLAELAAARAPALDVHHDQPAALEDRVGGLERLLVALAAAHGEHAAVRVDGLNAAA